MRGVQANARARVFEFGTIPPGVGDPAPQALVDAVPSGDEEGR